MSKKLGIFDIDGTIIAGSNLPESAVRAIRQFREAGNYAVFFTGRPYTHIDKRVIEIGFDGCVCTMGAYIRVGDKVVQNLKPAPEDVKQIIKAVRASGLTSVYESEEGISFDQSVPLSPFLLGLKKHFEQIGLKTDRNIDDEGFTFDKLCLWKNETSSFSGTHDALSPYLSLAGAKENMQEWSTKGVSARESMEKLVSFFDAEPGETYAFGDSITDLPFLSVAAHTAAMGQGHEELKSQVEYVTDPIDQDGLANAMAHFGMI